MDGTELFLRPKSQLGSANPVVKTVATMLLPGDLRRESLVVCPPSSGTITLGWDAGVSLTQGIILRSTDPPLVFSTILHGALAQSPLYAIVSATPISILLYWSGRGL